MRKMTYWCSLLTVALLAGCQDGILNPEAEPAATAQTSSDDSAAAKRGAQLGGMIWADGELFGTVGTPTSLNPDHGPFDALFQGGFKDGIGAISESKPGDQDYNGGRWHVYRLKQGVDQDKYLTACSVEDLDPKDFKATDTYFECPLLPIR